MSITAENTELWRAIIQLGIIAALILLGNILRRRVPLIRKSLMPTAVLGGFLLLALKSIFPGLVDTEFLEMITYHAIALGFIAMSLRVVKKDNKLAGSLTGAKSGALIVSTYLVQGILGTAIVLALVFTVMPTLFPAAGILLPMGYGQGPGQANNIGTSYEALGFIGGRSFGLSIAAAGYLCACIIGIIYLNVIKRRSNVTRVEHEEISGSVTVDAFQDENEIPVSESIDKFSIQIALVLLIYLLTYLVTWGITAALEKFAPGAAATVSSLLWGFNFIIGSLLAIGCKVLLKSLKKLNLMQRQYQNNYLLSRLSGLAFDIMIIAGIGSISISDLSGLWVPFILISVAGGVVTLLYLRWVCRAAYPDYYHEGMTSMYGMLTGTISSGVLLLREIDPNFETPAANNLVLGSSFGIAFGAPVLILVGLAPKSMTMLYIVIAIMAVYLVLLLLFIFKAGRGRRAAKKAAPPAGDDTQAGA